MSIDYISLPNTKKEKDENNSRVLFVAMSGLFILVVVLLVAVLKLRTDLKSQISKTPQISARPVSAGEGVINLSVNSLGYSSSNIETVRNTEYKFVITNTESVDSEIYHGFAVPKYNTSVVIPPGQSREVTLTFTSQGTTHFFSHVYPGNATSFNNIKGTISVR